MNAAEQRLVSLLDGRFGGRSDCYLAERPNGAAWIREPLTHELLMRHVRGDLRLGRGANGAACFGCIDLDGKRGDTAKAWADTRRLVECIDADGGVIPLVERSRSGQGWHVWILADPSDPPTLDEMRAFLRAALRAVGLPDDGAEGKGHPGVFPHGAGSKGIGRAPFLPWSGILSGAAVGLFVDCEGVPLDRQESALEDADLVTRTRLLNATELLEGMAEQDAQEPPGETESESGGAVMFEVLVSRLSDVEDRGDHEVRARCPCCGHHGLSVEERDGKLLVFCHHSGCRFADVLRALGFEPRREEPPDWTAEEDIPRDAPADGATQPEDAEARIEIVSMAELLKTEPRPVDWIAAGIVARKKASGLAGKRKGGKSKITHQLVLDVAAEREYALGFEPFRIKNPGPVLWIDLEQGRDELAAISHRLIAGGDYSETELRKIGSGIHWVCREARVDFSNALALARLQHTVKAEGIALTVIDSISGVQAYWGSENDNAVRRRIYNHVIAPLLDLGSGVICFGHTAIAHKDADAEVELRTRGGGDVLGWLDASVYLVGTRHEREHGDLGRVLRTITTLGVLETRGSDFDRCRVVIDGPTPLADETPGPLRVYAESILTGIGKNDVRDVNRIADAIVAALAEGQRFRSEVADSLKLKSGDTLFREALALATTDGRARERKASEHEAAQYRRTHREGGTVPSVLELLEQDE